MWVTESHLVLFHSQLSYPDQAVEFLDSSTIWKEKRIHYLSWLSFVRGRNMQEQTANGQSENLSGFKPELAWVSQFGNLWIFSCFYLGVKEYFLAVSHPCAFTKQGR